MSKRRLILLPTLLMLLFLLVSCYLVAGEQAETVPMDENRPGAYTVGLVSADGEGYRTIEAGLPSVPVIVDVSAQTEQGELVVAVLNLDGSPVVTATARFGLQGQGKGATRTDEVGRITLRITTAEARNGTYTVRYRLAAPLTPTPTSRPTPAP